MGTLHSSSHRLGGIEVLIVEDHDDSRELWVRTLQYSGALVTAASSARQGITFCETLRPHVVITDLSMPDEDGVWLAEQLRARGKSMPLIAISGYSRLFADRLRPGLFVQMLQKPLDPWRLIEAVAYAIAR